MELLENINYIYVLSWHLKIVGNIVWSGANIGFIDTQHEELFQKYV